MECPAEPIDLALWREVPVIEGRAATLADIESCLAVFYLDGAGRPLTELDLPALATWQDDGGTARQVVIIQTESDPAGDIKIAGFVMQDGSVGAGLLNEFTIIEQSQDN